MKAVRVTKQAALVVLWAFLLACSHQGPPYSPDKALGLFELPEGFRIELAAAEPEVVDPVAITFDEQGRMYVVEMLDYPLDLRPLGQIKRLEDLDGDGYYEKSTVFADGLNFPNGVMRWRDGVLVTSAPDILYLADSDGDGRADVRRVVLTGFSATNPQLRVNGLRYGVDNWIYANYPRVIRPRKYMEEFGHPGDALRFPDHPDAPPLDIRAEDVRFRPDEPRVEALGGVSQFGNSFDHWGNRFTAWNNDYVRHLVIESRYLKQNPYLAVEKAYHSPSGLDHSAQVYPVTENPLYVHDSQVGHFTSACGLSVYTGAALPEDFANNTFNCEPVHNLVRRSVVKPQGATFAASPAYDGREFLASKDSWFRPVFTTTGPDGALYIADYYRISVEHPEFVPPELSKEIEFDSPHQLGRIYRVVHESSKLWPQPNLAKASTAELVENLRHQNQWWRMESQRLLMDRQDRSAIEPLLTLARQENAPKARLHALWSLDGLKALDNQFVIEALADPHPAVRRHAIRLAENRLPDAGLQQKLYRLVDDPDPAVQFQLGLTLSLRQDDLPARQTFRTLQQIALGHLEDPWFRIAVLTSAADNAVGWFRTMLRSPGFGGTPSEGKKDFLRRAAAIVGARHRDTKITDVLAMVRSGRGTSSAWWQTAGLEGLGKGLSQGSGGRIRLPRGQSALVSLLSESGPEIGTAALELASRVELTDSVALRRLIKRKTQVAQDDQADLAEREYAAGVLGLDPSGATGEPLASLIAPQQPAEVRRSAARALTYLPGADAANLFTERWRTFSAPVREVALAWFFADRTRLHTLLDAVEAGKIQPWALGPARSRQLRRYPLTEIKERALALLEQAQGEDRQAVYESYLPALRLASDMGRGREIFRESCAECHKVGEMGHEVGPDLLPLTTRYKEVFLADILMPNQSVETGFEEYLVETVDGRSISGVIAKETPTTVTIRRAKGEEDTILRGNVKSMYSLSVSPMPEDLEQTIDVQGMADLIAFLKSLGT